MKFEWDEVKAGSNFKDHGVSFELAKTVFGDAFAIDRIDDRDDYGRSVSSSSAWRKGRFYCLSLTRSAAIVFE